MGATLRNLARDRFVELPAEVSALVDRPSSDQLTRWARQCPSLDDWLRAIRA